MATLARPRIGETYICRNNGVVMLLHFVFSITRLNSRDWPKTRVNKECMRESDDESMDNNDDA